MFAVDRLVLDRLDGRLVELGQLRRVPGVSSRDPRYLTSAAASEHLQEKEEDVPELEEGRREAEDWEERLKKEESRSAETGFLLVDSAHRRGKAAWTLVWSVSSWDSTPLSVSSRVAVVNLRKICAQVKESKRSRPRQHVADCAAGPKHHAMRLA